MSTKFGVRGDFEITASFESPLADAPDVGYGLGPDLLIKPAGGWDNFASLSRFRRPDDVVFSMVHRFKVGDELRVGRATPSRPRPPGADCGSSGSAGSFITRSRKDDESGFHEVFRSAFGTQDLEFVRIAATPGNSRCPVEVIWGDLTVRAEELTAGPKSLNPVGRDESR